VTKEQLRQVNTRSILSALQFFDPSIRVKQNNQWGSDPNALPEFNIRGESSVGLEKSLAAEDLRQTQRTDLQNNPNLPIFILDNFEVSSQKIYDMDMNRVESITVLKDAAATALYGSRAANGVILITTIAPKPGELQVDYSIGAEFYFPDLSDYNMANAAEKVEIEWLAGLYTGSDPNSQAQITSAIEYNNLKNQILRGVNTDWLALPLQNTVTSRHNISFSGGAQSLRYSLGFRYDDQDGVMKGSKRDRVGAELKLIYIYKKLQLHNTTSYDYTGYEDSPYGVFSEYVRQLPYLEVYDDDGKYLRRFKDFSTEINPLWKTTTESYSGRGYIHDITNQFQMHYDVITGVRLVGLFNILKNDKKTTSFKDPTLPEYDNFSGSDAGQLDQSFGNGYNWDLQFRLQLARAFGLHNILAMGAFEMKDNKDETVRASYRGFQLGQFFTPIFAARQVAKTDVSSVQRRSIGYKGAVNYTYNNIYLADLSLTVDGNSEFGSDKRYGTFWSVGAGINIHNYDWFTRQELIQELRLRGSFGVTGNVGFPPYSATTTYSIDSEKWYYMGPGAYIYYLGNSDLMWQSVETFDTSLEFALWQSKRLNFKISYYHKKTINMVDEVAIQTSSGFDKYRANSGSLLNEGIELDISGTPIATKDFRVWVHASLASNRNRIISLGDASKLYNEQLNENYDGRGYYTSLMYVPVIRYYEGASTSAIYAVRSAGIDPSNGQEKFYRQGGQGTTYTWSSADQVVVGDYNPDASGSIAINVSYKDFYVQTGFRYQWGAQIYNETLLNKVENADIAKYNVDKRVLTERWKKPGDIAPYYDLQRNIRTRPTSRFVQTENYLLMDHLSGGYRFNINLISKWKMRLLDLSFNANDVFRWSTVKMERGIAYPFAHRFDFTLRMGF
jgi:TonB-linked SusC/RagA family outer membrane protein